MVEYRGSRLLHPLAEVIGLPVDQLNFVVCQLVALAFSYFFFKHFSPQKFSASVRHGIALVLGTALALFCFGRQIFHLYIQALFGYLVLKFGPAKHAHKLVFAVSMCHLSYMHIWRLIYDYGGYTLDITGPMMISTQKVVSFAFSVKDGLHTKEDTLNQDQRKYAIRAFPGLLDYLSYIMYFQGILVGPLCFYNDYKDFIEGTSFKDKSGKVSVPSPSHVVTQKTVGAFVYLGLFMVFGGTFSKPMNANKEYIASHSYMQRCGFLLISVALARFRYYFAWKLGEAVNNASGLGFNGYDQQGQARWDLVDNVNVRGLETATSFKGIVDNWNIQTTAWLRRVCYDRVPFQRTLMTYILSAIWHGFYPGYYFSFGGGALITLTARQVRRRIRPAILKLNIPSIASIYDVFTWFCSQFALAYLIVPFSVLELGPIMYFYTYSMYWFVHIVCLVILILYMVVFPSKSTKKRE